MVAMETLKYVRKYINSMIQCQRYYMMCFYGYVITTPVYVHQYLVFKMAWYDNVKE
jgi:hypothetical protein